MRYLHESVGLQDIRHCCVDAEYLAYLLLPNFFKLLLSFFQQTASRRRQKAKKARKKRRKKGNTLRNYES